MTWDIETHGITQDNSRMFNSVITLDNSGITLDHLQIAAELHASRVTLDLNHC